MSKVSFIIPSRNEILLSNNGETLLQRTVRDIYEKATGEFEVIVAFDGPPYQPLPDYPNLIRLELPQQGLKPCVNQAAEIATGKYLYKSDSHCMFSKGIDEVLQSKIEDNWVVMPRFYVLDAENWKFQDERYYDYFFLDCPLTDKKGYRFKAGGHWPERTKERLSIGPLDESLTLHGSGWMINRDFFLNELGGMQVEGYGVSFMEPADLGNRVWLGKWGGKVMVRKDCWLAHAHKGGQRDRGYPISMREVKRSYNWTANFWMRNQWKERAHDLEWLIDRFKPVPTWPDNWKELQAKYEMENPVWQ